jgi:PIF1-like helicase
VAKIRSGGNKRAKSKYGSPLDRWTKTQCLFIDEISMLSSQLFAKLDQIGRALRYRPAIPFGGIQIVLLGDFLQLPPIERDSPALHSSPYSVVVHHHHHNDQDDEPVASKSEKEKEAEEALAEQKILESKYLFFSEAWQKAIHSTVLLRRVYRQNDDKFVALLGRARMGELLPDDFRLLLSRVQPDPGRRVCDKNGIEAPLLHSFRKSVENENMRCLKELSGNFFCAQRRVHYVTVRRPSPVSAAAFGVTASSEGRPMSVPPIVVHASITRADGDAQYAAKKLGETITAPDRFLFKIGAAVMLLVNLDVGNKLVNGLRGTILAIGPEPPPPPPPPPAPPTEPNPQNSLPQSTEPSQSAALAQANSSKIVSLGTTNGAMDADAKVGKITGLNTLSLETTRGVLKEPEQGQSGPEEATAADLAAAAAWRRRMRERDDDEQEGRLPDTGAGEDGDDDEGSGTELLTGGDDEKIWIRFEGISEPVGISRYRWKHCLVDSERNLPEAQWSEYVEISQFPLNPAYASTIHKTQSLELTAAVLSLGEEVKEAGQAYTALSRIKSIEGVFIARLSSKAFRADLVTKSYYQRLAELAPPLSGPSTSTPLVPPPPSTVLTSAPSAASAPSAPSQSEPESNQSSGATTLTRSFTKLTGSFTKLPGSFTTESDGVAPPGGLAFDKVSFEPVNPPQGPGPAFHQTAIIDSDKKNGLQFEHCFADRESSSFAPVAMLTN